MSHAVGNQNDLAQVNGPEPTSDAAETSSWNRQATLERLGGDEKLLLEVMDIFVNEAPKHLAELREAITQRDAATVERIAHSLQGELGYLDITALSHTARELEAKGRDCDLAGALGLLSSFEADMSQLLSSINVSKEPGSNTQTFLGTPGVSS